MLLNFIITKEPLISLQHNAEGIKKLFSETTSEINTGFNIYFTDDY